jgi:hypothetical protein
MAEPDLAHEVSLRRELLRVVLRDTLRKTGVPPQWIGGETTPYTDPDGQLTIEIRLVLECDEPRFLYYLAAFQGEFESRLLAIEPNAWDWISRISWSLGARRDTDPDFQMPTPDYWEHVVRDRQLAARQAGRMEWDREALAHHFEDTSPADEQEDFQHTAPPAWDAEDLAGTKP